MKLSWSDVGLIVRALRLAQEEWQGMSETAAVPGQQRIRFEQDAIAAKRIADKLETSETSY